jgi:hypothetical protein
VPQSLRNDLFCIIPHLLAQIDMMTIEDEDELNPIEAYDSKVSSISDRDIDSLHPNTP